MGIIFGMYVRLGHNLPLLGTTRLPSGRVDDYDPSGRAIYLHALAFFKWVIELFLHTTRGMDAGGAAITQQGYPR